jgi:predicted nucleotidyltransferase
MNSLNDKIWDKNGKIIPMVREKLLVLANKVANEVATLVKIKNIYFTGSLAGYNWTPLSDIDLHIIVDILEKHSDNTLNEYFDLICKLFNSQHNIFIKGYKVEVNMKETESLLKDKALYDLEKNKWVIKPVDILRDMNDTDVISLTKEYQRKIDLLILQNGSIDEAKELKAEIKSLRKEGLAKEGEFSVGNLVFKKLRNTEYIAKLFDYWNKLEDQELSLEKFKSFFSTSL